MIRPTPPGHARYGLLVAVVCVMPAATTGWAQSTVNLEGVGKRRHVEVSAGAEPGRLVEDANASGRLSMAMVAVRWRTDQAMGYRLWASWIRRGASESPYCTLYPQNCPSASDPVVAGVAADLRISTMGRHTTMAASAGAGVVIATHTRTGGYPANAPSRCVLAGLALRHRILVVEAHALILGGDLYTPVTLGLRF